MKETPSAKRAVRLNQLLAQSGLCSRREADQWITAGRVTIHGLPAQLGDRVADRSAVRVDGKPLPAPTQPVVYALNKPLGIICTTDRRIRDNVIDWMQVPQRIFPIGRLDRDSHGLLLLTNDGSIVNPILRTANAHEKEYKVQVDRPFDEDFVRQMSAGVPVLGTVTLPCRLTRTGPDRFRLVLKQGLNRQIRRMCAHLGYQVIDLQRVRIMHITLGSLKRGHYRQLTVKEMRDLHDLLSRKPKKKTARPCGVTQPPAP